jgi:Zn-dependent protease
MTHDLILGVVQVVILVYSVVIHEVSHGFMARALGDTTAERLGRLTLNPLAHLDMVGSVILPILTKLSTGFMFGYAKPVPYDPNQLIDRRWGPAKVAAAGPLANVLLALVFAGVVRFAVAGNYDTVALLAYSVVWTNIILAGFNLMPVPPLDGHWLLNAVMPASWRGVRVVMHQNQWILLLVVLFIVFPAVSPLLSWVVGVLVGQ